MDDLPAFDDYSVKGHTYQYFEGDPLYEFGYGLSYTKFGYKSRGVSLDGDTVRVKFKVTNTGKRDGDEVAQVYVKYPETGTYMPAKQLKGFSRLHLRRGKSSEVVVSVPVKELRYWDEQTGGFVTPKGEYEFMVGASSEDIRLREKIVL